MDRTEYPIVAARCPVCGHGRAQQHAGGTMVCCLAGHRWQAQATQARPADGYCHRQAVIEVTQDMWDDVIMHSPDDDAPTTPGPDVQIDWRHGDLCAAQVFRLNGGASVLPDIILPPPDDQPPRFFDGLCQQTPLLPAPDAMLGLGASGRRLAIPAHVQTIIIDWSAQDEVVPMPADADAAVPDFNAWAQQVQAHIDGTNDALSIAQPGDTAPSRLQHLNDVLAEAFDRAYDHLVIGTTDRSIDRPGWRHVRPGPPDCPSRSFPTAWDNDRILTACLEHIHASLGAYFCGDIIVRWAPALAGTGIGYAYRLTYRFYVRG